MHTVIVDEELPYPPTSGKRLRIFNLVMQLAERHRMTLLCHRNADAQEAREAETFFHDHNIETVLVDRRKSFTSRHLSSLSFSTRIALNLFSPVPYSVQWNDCPQLKAAVRRYAAEHEVDIWQCEWAPYANAIMGLEGARWVMMAHDIQSRTWERYYRSELNPLKRWYIGKQWRKYRRYEQCVFAQAPLTITVTREDAEQAGRMFSARRTAVVDNGVDVTHYSAAACESIAPRRPGDILFLGNLEWRPNLDAVRTLLDQVFPQVLAEAPSARLCIVGRQPPEWLLQRCRSIQNVEVHANVPDVRPYLYRCGVMAVPLRIGSGSRLKILEALATGLPVISTKVGSEGLCMSPGVHYAEAESPEEMAGLLVRWIRNPALTRDMVSAGRCLVENQYDWSMLAKKMENAWGDLIESTKT